MCCFSLSVRSVHSTNIFVRAGLGGRQSIVYSMSIDADQELAMVLPIPVKPGVPENDVEFVDLKDYPDFFQDMTKGFAERPQTRGIQTDAVTSTPSNALEVHEVGDFEASFVPTVKDFARLDKRFQMPAGTWEKLPQYKDYGFAVFKLKAGAKTFHPMAFSFTREDTTKLFFPTVHIHDGEVHEKAAFDHVLYLQPRTHDQLELGGWEESEKPAMDFIKTKKTKGVVAGNEHCYRKELEGMLPNADTWIESQYIPA